MFTEILSLCMIHCHVILPKMRRRLGWGFWFFSFKLSLVRQAQTDIQSDTHVISTHETPDSPPNSIQQSQQRVREKFAVTHTCLSEVLPSQKKNDMVNCHNSKVV